VRGTVADKGSVLEILRQGVRGREAMSKGSSEEVNMIGGGWRVESRP